MIRGGLMVCGTTSDAGKSLVVTGLCRVLARQGVRVAPFKAQNMALNSGVTPDGHEIGRAQMAQAAAAGAIPEVAMNPILLKPTGERESQVVVLGEPVGVLSATEYHDRKPQLLGLVLDALADLRSRFDVVLCEGAGSPAEINLLDHDIVNLRVARDAGLPAVVVGDIDRGGVFAALAGTVGLLPEDLRAVVHGFLVNRLRGDPALLLDGTARLHAVTGLPTLGVLPWIDGLDLDAEDSLALRRPPRPAAPPLADPLDVAVVRFPLVSNFTDLDPLAVEPGVALRWVHGPADLGRPDLLILPGSKATVRDLEWLRATGLADAIAALDQGLVLGICGGYQALGRRIEDPHAVEAPIRGADGLGLLDVVTEFRPGKVTRPRTGWIMGEEVHGYQIHHGRVRPGDGTGPWVSPGDGGEPDGAVDLHDARVIGTTWHGLLEADGFRRTFLTEVGRRAGKAFVPDPSVSFAAARRAQHDRIADAIEAHCDLDRLLQLITAASTPRETTTRSGTR